MLYKFTDSGIINCSDLNNADHVLLGLNYDTNPSGPRGTEKGPEAIIEALRFHTESFSSMLFSEPCRRAKIFYFTPNGCRYNLHSLFPELENHVCFLNILSPRIMVEQMEKVCLWLLMNKKKITILGGEHTVSIPGLKTYADLHKPTETTIVQVSARLALKDIDGHHREPAGKLTRCSVMRRAHEMGYTNIMQVGARDFSREEWEFARGQGINVIQSGYSMLSPDDVAKKIRTQKVIIDFNVDGVCPGDMPATGNPVGGGPGLDYVRELFHCIGTTREIVLASVTEIAPDLAPGDMTARNAAKVIYDLIGYRI